MSATNLTKNLKLPQFVASDKPSWLGDVNGAMKNIDDGIEVIKGDITKASNTASSAKSQSDANTVTLGNVNTELENIGNRVTALEAGGGTEQLEQRVQTVEGDIDALQTRADTFEEEIAKNGTNITNVTKSVTELTPRVKRCEDNINSLTSTVHGNSQTIEDLTAIVSSVSSTADRADTNASSALRIATDASNKSNTNTNSISTLSAKVDQINPINVGALTLINSSANFLSASGFTVFNTESNFFYMMMPIMANANVTVTTTPIAIGTIDLSGIFPASMGMELAWSDTSIKIGNTYDFIISATKITEEKKITLYIKSPAGNRNLTPVSTVTPVFTFNLY